LDQPVGLAPRALRDIKAGQAAGRFGVLHAEVELSAVAGGLLGLLKVHVADPDEVDMSSVDDLARALLRLLGVPDQEAARIIALDLPSTQPW
ncbi:MAG: TetR/AcrR family transcriptional regulator, partial [Candidatus Limnocylindrales bacterium]